MNYGPLGDGPPCAWRGPGYDGENWWTRPHPPGVTYHNCRHRRAGCHACKREIDAERRAEPRVPVLGEDVPWQFRN